ncbi:MAG: hypothetical protein KBD27_01835 [Candidatus Moranbacteria bacterium]|nr:hypothetical protein [Candidatus Moranbacteria bacterium]
MKRFLDFLKYNNVVPFIFLALLLGAGTALATNSQLRQSVFSPETLISSVAPEKTDTAKLLALNLKTLDLGLRIDTLTEDGASYYVSYSYRTWEVVEHAWQETRKTGKMDIPKALLGKRDLKTYLIEQISQVMDRELAYLGEAQAVARTTVVPKQSSKYASLVGSEVTKDDVLSARKDTASDVAVKKESKRAPGGVMTVETETQSGETVLSREEIEKIIVSAVAQFLAVETSMPSTANLPAPIEEEPLIFDEPATLPELPEEPAVEEESPRVP